MYHLFFSKLVDNIPTPYHLCARVFLQRAIPGCNFNLPSHREAGRLFHPNLSNRRIASARVIPSSVAHSSIDSSHTFGSRIAKVGSCPVAGRPTVLFNSVLHFLAIFMKICHTRIIETEQGAANDQAD